MMLIRNYLGSKVKRYYKNYLNVFFSIILSYIFISLTFIYIDNILVLNSGLRSMDNIYISIRTIFFLAGIMFIVYQYYNIFMSGIKDYRVMKVQDHNGVTILQFEILVQMFLLLLITIPAGIMTGKYIISKLLHVLEGFALSKDTLELIDVDSTSYLVTGLMCCIIISLGVYFTWTVRKYPISNNIG